eukprot:GEZU01008629.1.p2 GENE.GEZU01008629.1~~GEZU01008629.1.p2  ORF type:complete len:106 (+),score=1.15 GEZU01008629.1:461-778(+)
MKTTVSFAISILQQCPGNQSTLSLLLQRHMARNRKYTKINTRLYTLNSIHNPKSYILNNSIIILHNRQYNINLPTILNACQRPCKTQTFSLKLQVEPNHTKYHVL